MCSRGLYAIWLTGWLSILLSRCPLIALFVARSGLAWSPLAMLAFHLSNDGTNTWRTASAPDPEDPCHLA
jgi:hypothetical protein